MYWAAECYLQCKDLREREPLSSISGIWNDDVHYVESEGISAVGDGYGLLGKHRPRNRQIDFLLPMKISDQ